MAKRENPPFPRGSTWYNGGTIDSNNLGGENLEGTIWEFEDLDLSATGAKSLRSNKPVKCMIVRNKAGAALLKATSGATFLAQVDGYADTTAESPTFPVDEWLAAAGVPDNDLFYVVIEGPATVMTPLTADANNVFEVGTLLVSLTAVTSGSTTSGRVRPIDLTGATALLGAQIIGRIGRALSAKTTANTNADLLADITRF
jgi:hypothetical protein